MNRILTSGDIDFSTLVRPGDTVIWTQGASEPLTLIEALLAQRQRIGRFNVFLGASYAGIVRPEHADCITFIGPGAVGTNFDLAKARRLDLIPCHLSDLAQLIGDGRLRTDIVLMQLSPKDSHGCHSLGAVNGYVQAALPQARIAIAEVNHQAPWTFARDPVNNADFDHFIETDRPLVEAPARHFSDEDTRIARHIVGFIPDAAALQIGIGGVPNAIFAQLRDHRNLGLHTGVIGDGVIDLIEAGIINNARKSRDAGVSITGGLMGTKRLYDYAHLNGTLRVEPTAYTHDPIVLSGLDRLICVNSAIEVDLTGQLGSEVAGGYYRGTIGGQIDFARGAFLSQGGRSIIGLPARTTGGRTRIVSSINSGTVTCARSDADIVVTEFGAAELRGQTISERVRRMIAIAHPDEREQLERQSREEIIGYFG